MRIAQVAPLFESVPPRLYGGTERVVSCLTEELVSRGHEVTLFASADSVTRARLRPCTPQALRLGRSDVDPLACHVLMIEQVFKEAKEFDIVHFHIDYLHFPLTRRYKGRHITTLHGRLDLPGMAAFYREFEDVPVVSISNAQRKPLPWANWQATVYNGIAAGAYRAHSAHGSYLAFLGRISPEKGVDRAIEIARRVGMELRIAAKVDKADQEYFDTHIKPLLSQPGVEFIGEIGEAEKCEFLGKAYALLFPIDWPEPFGLTMAEAMACGTPVIAFRRGSVPEVMEDGVTGFVVQTVEEAVEAVMRIPSIDRRQCRRVFEDRFSGARMARDYLEVYAGMQTGLRPYLVG